MEQFAKELAIYLENAGYGDSSLIDETIRVFLSEQGYNVAKTNQDKDGQ